MTHFNDLPLAVFISLPVIQICSVGSTPVADDDTIKTWQCF